MTQCTGELFNPISTGQGRNQPLYERHVTKFGRNRVNLVEIMPLSENVELHTSLQMGNLKDFFNKSESQD